MVQQNTFVVTNNPIGCPNVCRTRTFRLEREDFKDETPYVNSAPILDYTGGDMRQLNLKISSPVIDVSTEFEVYDFNGIVGSVGGSLGLFIGFSFFDFLLAILDKTIIPMLRNN